MTSRSTYCFKLKIIMIIDFNLSSATFTSSTSFDDWWNILWTAPRPRTSPMLHPLQIYHWVLGNWGWKAEAIVLDETPQHPKHIRSLPGKQRQVESINDVMSSIVSTEDGWWVPTKARGTKKTVCRFTQETWKKYGRTGRLDLHTAYCMLHTASFQVGSYPQY